METKELTILKAIENIHTQSKGSLLLLEWYESVNYEIDLVSNYFKINKLNLFYLHSTFAKMKNGIIKRIVQKLAINEN